MQRPALDRVLESQFVVVDDDDPRLSGDEPPSIRERLERAGVPARYVDASWESWRRPPVIDQHLDERLRAIREWRGDEQHETTLTLRGDPGAGKTHLATATLRRFVGAGNRGGLWVSVSGLLHRLRQIVATGSDEDLMGKLIAARLLVLDDLGAQKSTDWTVDRLYLLIATRYDALRPTIITTNLSLNDIRDRLDARIASRLADGLVVHLDLPDWRASRRRER